MCLFRKRMKYFTKAQIEEIRKQLATMGVRDTDLPDVTAPLSGSELVAIVQNGENRKVGVRKLIHDYLPDNIADGEDGASAYEVWKSQPGNEGKSVEQFLESLKGEKGETGATGPAGPAGAAGARGANGAAGAAAGFGTPTASVDTTEGGQLGVSITASGPDTAKIFNFVFHNLTSGGGATPTDTGKVMYSSQATNPGNPNDNPNLWHTTRTSYDVWMAFCFLVNGSWGDWTILYIGDIDIPYASFKSFAFTRAASQPNAPTGGNYSSPIPTTAGWYDGIPAGSGAIWMSSRIFASDGTHSDANWSTPRLLADNEFMDYEFSSVANPGVPSKATPSSAETNPNWSNEATESTIWMGMREISNGAYKAGSTWMVVKIKGEDGKDGTSVTIKGTVSSVSDLPSTGNITGDGYLVNGNLYVWDGDSWENCGRIQGPPGADGDTPYIHIKYSNDGGAHFTANDGEDPGDYIGLYWDYTAEDSANVSSYTWKYWKGEDGFGYEYIFKLTTTNTAPNLPSTSPNTDDYVPTSEGWTDDPGGVSAEYPYCWVAWRKKEDGVWSAWHGTTNDKARLYSYYGQDGTDGTDGIDGKDALPIRIRNWSEIGGVTLTGNDKVFSGYEDNAPFRDVIVITSDVYPSGITYPFTIADPLGTGSVDTPALVVVNYSDSYPNGFSGTDLSLPTSSTYTNSIASNKTESSTLYGQGRVYSVFQNLGAVYARILVATQGYIGALTVDHLTTNAGNNSYIVIDDGFICFYDSNNHLRIKMGQGSGDTSPVINFYSTSDPVNPLYNLGPDGMMQLDSTFSAPHFYATRFWHFSSISTGNKIVCITSDSAHHDYGSGAVYSDTPLYWFKYSDAMKVVWLTQSQSVVQYQNPDTGQYSSSTTKYNDMYFLQGDFSYNAPDGYYVIDPTLWTSPSTYAVRATALRIVTQSGTKKYYYGQIDMTVDTTDIDYGGISGTISDIKVNSLFE